MSLRRGLVPAALVPLLLLASGCFEPPITETIEVRFLAPDGVGVTISVSLAPPATQSEGNRVLAERMEEARRSLWEGRDDWSRRIARLAPVFERGFWEKHEGELVRWVRRAAFESPDDLARFFSDTAIHPTVLSGAGYRELAIIPSRPVRATREQERRLAEEMDRWSEALAAYYAAGDALHRHLRDHPDRARACYGSIFSAYISEESKESVGEPAEADSAVLEPLQESMKHVLEALDVPGGEAYSLEELSRIVYDPFPATLSVRLPGPATEVEGFVAAQDGRLVAPAVSLWASLRSLEGRYLSPDPMLAIVAHDRAGKEEPFDLDGFVARPRRLQAPPSAMEIAAALRRALAPAPLYRVRWSTVGLEEKEDVEDWLSGGKAAP